MSRGIVVVGSGDIGGDVALMLEEAKYRVTRTHRLTLDVTSTDSVRSALSEVKDLSGVVVCHGAPGCIKPSVELSDEEFQKIIDIDLVGTFRVCREAAKLMPLGGSIINISSIHAFAPYPRRAAYAAAKAGVVGLTKALAIEWAKRQIRVNCILPGQVVSTRRSQALGSETLERFFERSPSGGLTTTTHIGHAVISLLANRGITGHALVVDAGWTASSWPLEH